MTFRVCENEFCFKKRFIEYFKYIIYRMTCFIIFSPCSPFLTLDVLQTFLFLKGTFGAFKIDSEMFLFSSLLFAVFAEGLGC